MSDSRATAGPDASPGSPRSRSLGAIVLTWLILALGLGAGLIAAWGLGVLRSEAPEAGATSVEMSLLEAIGLGLVEGILMLVADEEEYERKYADGSILGR